MISNDLLFLNLFLESFELNNELRSTILESESSTNLIINKNGSDLIDNDDESKCSKRKLFTEEEDNLLKKAALTYQNVSWNDIAKFVPGRTPKQCRDRWVNYLQPSLKNSPFSEDEDRLLFFLVSIYGTHWSKMKSHFPTRSTNSIKNRWYWFNKRTTKKLANLSNDLIQMQNASKNNEQNKYLIDNNPKQMCLINCKSLDNKDQKKSEVTSITNEKCQGNLDSKLVNQNDNAKLSKPVNNNIIFDDEIIKLSIDELDW
ncbi:hypothetical protein M9Y10_014423 [Tritrichomonas musculus]|uniref:Myb-like DNA-binding domain containing protein n=1 Tax=Tritrichomonas musculus TaxID=1915356 RepID=A0ABR2KZG4_9EUKA